MGAREVTRAVTRTRATARRVVAATVIVAALGAVACLGPRPRVVATHLAPPTGDDDTYVATITLINGGRGSGEAGLTTSLLPDAGKGVVAQDSRTISLQPHETVTVVIPLRAARRGTYRIVAEAMYPP